MNFQLSLSTDPVTAAYPDQPLLVAPQATVGEVMRLLRTQHTGNVLVCDNGSLQGIFTERDALKWMAAQLPIETPISEAMSADPVSLKPDTPVADAIKLMSEGGYRQLPILSSEGTPTGMVGVQGIVHYLVDHFPDTIYTLPPEPNVVPSEREGA